MIDLNKPCVLFALVTPHGLVWTDGSKAGGAQAVIRLPFLIALCAALAACSLRIETWPDCRPQPAAKELTT